MARFFGLFMAAIGFLRCFLSAGADDLGPDKFKLMAAFTVKIASFVNQLAEQESLTVCVDSADALAWQAFTEIDGRREGKRLIKIVDTAAGVKSGQCNMVFVGEASAIEPSQIAGMGKIHALVVGDKSDLIASGGAVEFFRAGTNMRFRISRTNLKASQLDVSSQLLNLAQLVD